MLYHVNGIMKIFSQRLKEERERAGLTQKQVADSLGIILSTYQGYEALGTRHREPDLEMVAKIANVLNTTADYLIGRVD